MISRPTPLLCAVACAVLAACGIQSNLAVKKASPVTLIKFERTGGLAGLKVAGTLTFSANHAYVDAESVQYRRELGGQERKQVLADAETADFEAAKAALASSGNFPDGYRFDITVIRENGAIRSLSLGDDAARRLGQFPAVVRLAAWVEREAGNISSRI